MCDPSSLMSGAGDALSGLFDSGSAPLANTASDAAASEIAGAIPSAAASGGADLAGTALSALPSAAETAASFDFGSIGATGVGGTGGGTLATAGMGAPVSNIASQVASNAGSVAASPVGAAGGGVSAAALGAAPGSDLGGVPLPGTDTNVPIGDIAQQYGSPIGPGLPSSPGGAPPASTGGGVLGAIKDFTGVNSLKDALSPALATAGLATAATKPQTAPFTNQLQGSADQLAGQGAALTAGLQTGVLPPGLQSAIDTATAAQKAHIRSQYAGMGLSGSTMEQQALQQVDQAAEQQKFQQISDLVKTGLGETSAANQIYQQLQQQQLAQDASLGDSISKFAAALAPARAA